LLLKNNYQSGGVKTAFKSIIMKIELFIKKENERRMNKLKKSKLHIYAVIAFLILVSLSVKAQNGFRINKTEFFTISTSIDPSASIKEKGIDIVGEIEYAGSLYLALSITTNF